MRDFERLEVQLSFIKEVDRIKSIFRKSKLFSAERHENDAEHSWHIALMAIILQEYAGRPIDISRVVTMLLIHDIVEIDTGDTIIYKKGHGHVEAEEKAARRIFGILPDEQADYFIDLWREFEARESNDARYAAAIDRIQPCLQNMHRGGETWREHGIKPQQVIEVNSQIGEGAPDLWKYVKRELDTLFE
jgi:putative hydrolase of HD superfamily